MSSGKKKGKKKRPGNKDGNRSVEKTNYDAKEKADAKQNRAGNRQVRKQESGAIGWMDYTAAAAGILMCLLTVFMLAANLFADDPERQYELYPAAFRVIDICIIVVGVTCLGMMAYMRNKQISEKKAKRRKRSYGKPGSNYLVTRLKTERFWVYFSVFLICIFISTCINGLDSKAIHGLPYRNIGVFNMAAFILLYMGASACIRTERMRRAVIISFAAAADLIALSALYEEFAGDIIAYHAKKELSAIFFNGNHYGYFLTMAVLTGIGLAIFADGWQMWLGVVTALLNLPVLGINHSLGCIIAVILVAAVTAIAVMIREPHRRMRVYMILSAAFAVFAAAMICLPEIRSEFAGLLEDAARIMSGNARGSEGHNRLKIWTKTWKYIMEKPLFGYGCEGISERLYIASAISNPHSEILTYAAYYGIPAAIAYIAGVISVLGRVIRSKHFSDAGVCIAFMAACGYFVSSLTGVAMFYLTPFLFIFIGICISENNI